MKFADVALQMQISNRFLEGNKILKRRSNK